jgi:hypothetical protein
LLKKVSIFIHCSYDFEYTWQIDPQAVDRYLFQWGVIQDCWLLEYPWQLEKNKDWSDGLRLVEPRVRIAYGSERVMASGS